MILVAKKWLKQSVNIGYNMDMEKGASIQAASYNYYGFQFLNVLVMINKPVPGCFLNKRQ
jgi:hypothetical protein